ncbi:MAG: MFS transporter [Clostridia bacterium]|nr:MFS transporter [Clostridia bacterium]
MKDNFVKNIVLLGLFNFLTEFKLYAAFLILFFSQATGSILLGMSLFSITMLSSTLMELPTGLLSDLAGRRRTLILGALVSLVSIVFIANGRSFWILAGGSILEGIALAFFSGNNDAFLFDHLKSFEREKDFAHYLGKTQAAAHLALSLASVSGGALVFLTSYTFVLWLSVIPKALALVICFFMDEPIKISQIKKSSPFSHFKEVFRELKHNRSLRTVVIADSLTGGAGEAAYQFRAHFLRLVWPLWAIGLAGTLSDLGAALSFWFGGRVLKKTGTLRCILLSKIYSMATNLGGYFLANSFSPILLASNSLFYGVTTVAQNELAQGFYTDSLRASLGSFKSVVTSLTYAVLSLLIGWLAEKIGVSWALISFQLFSATAVLLYIQLFKRLAKENRMS